MIGIPFAILALAAGVYLLIQVKHYGFGGIYKALAWLVILLSLASMGFGIARGVMHHRHMGHGMVMGGHCDMGGGGPEACPYMPGGHGPMAPGGPACCAGDSSPAGMHDAMGKSACCSKGATTAADSGSHR